MCREIRVFRNQKMYENNLRVHVYMAEPPFEKICSGVSDNIGEIIGKIRLLKIFGYKIYVPKEDGNLRDEYPLHPLDEGHLIRELKL